MTKPVIVTRASKGSALSWTEGDANVTNLQNATIGITDGTTSGTLDLNDTLTFTAGSNVTLGYNSSTKTLTITAAGGSGITDVVQDTTPQLGGNLDVNGYSIVSASNGNIGITPNGSGNIQLTPSTGKIILGATEWPSSTGTSGQVLTSGGGAGVLSWTTVSGGATTLDELTDVVITAAATNDALIFDGTNWVDTALSGITVGTASVGSTVTLTADNTTNATNYPLFVNAATGNLSPRTDTGFTYNPSTGALTATTFSGAASQVTLASTTGNGNNPSTYLVLATGSGAQSLHTDSNNLTWNASNDLLEVGNSNGYFNGNIGVSPASARAARFSSLEFKYPIEPTYTLTYGATITPNATNGSVQKVTLTGNVTFSAFTSPVAGQSMTIIFVQDATGSRTLTSTMKFSGASKTLSTAANAIDIITVYYDGTTYYASLAKGFA